MMFDPISFALSQQEAGSGSGSGGAPADWNAKEGEAGYVKNRTHWEEVGEPVEILPETTVVIEGGQGFVENVLPLTDGGIYTITWNGVEYTCVGFYAQDAIYAGDLYTASGGGLGAESTGEPFAFGCFNGGLAIMCLDGSSEVVLSIVGKNTTVHKIDKKYLPVVTEDSGFSETGMINKDTIINTVCGEVLYPKVGVTTYEELYTIRDRSVLHKITMGNDDYVGVKMRVFGTGSVGHCIIVALDDYGRGCRIEMLLDGIDDDSVVTSIEVVSAE
jgi:hypothetical protein